MGNLRRAPSQDESFRDAARSRVSTSLQRQPKLMLLTALTVFLLLTSFLVDAQVQQGPTCTSATSAVTPLPASASTQRIYAFGVQNANLVQFQTWGSNGQSDIQTLLGTQVGSTWYADFPMSTFDVGNPLYGNFTSVVLMQAAKTFATCGGDANGQISWSRLSPGFFSSPANYFYDANSRLTGQFSNQLATLSLDPLGNIQSVTQSIPTAVTINEFFPIQGGPGTFVTILGGPFDPVGTSGDSVHFNGVAGTLLQSSFSQLVAAVPSGASTGPISYSGPFGAATSIQAFTVLPNTGDPVGAQPTITTITPVGSTGVSLTGQHFLPYAGQTVVRLGSTQVAATVSDTQISFTLPATQATDFIYVTTPFGTAKSSAPFSVSFNAVPLATKPPVPLTKGGAAAQLSITGASSCGAYSFAGSAGDWLTLQFSQLTFGSGGSTVDYALFGPNNQPVESLDNASYNKQNTALSICGLTNAPQVIDAVSGSFSNGGDLNVHLPALPITGTYTLVIDSTSATSFRASAGLVADPVIAPSSGVSVTATPSASQRVRFTSVVGQTVVAEATTTAVTPSSATVQANWLSPNATSTMFPAQSAGLNATSAAVESAQSDGLGGVIITAPTAGETATDVVFLDTGNSGTVTVDGTSPTTFNQTAAGKPTQFLLPLTAGQSVSLALTNIVTSASWLNVYLFDPLGNPLANLDACSNSSCEWDFDSEFSTLPQVTGTYRLVVVPNSPSTYSGSLLLSSDLSAPITTQASVTLSRAGQTERLTYTAPSAAFLINVGTIAATPSTDYIWAWLYQPNAPFKLLNAIGSNSSNNLLYFGHNFTPGSPLTIQVTADLSSGYNVFNDAGIAATGSATIHIDTGPPVLTVNALHATPPLQSKILPTTLYAGAARMLQFPASSTEFISMTLSNITGSAIQPIVFFARNSAGTQWDDTYTTFSSTCNVGSTCAPDIPPNPYGSFPGMIVLMPQRTGLPSSWTAAWETIPYSKAATFGVTVTLQFFN